MAIKVPDEGELLLLDEIRAFFNGSNVVWQPFINDITPANSDVFATYTVPTDTGGANFNVSDFGAPSTNGAGEAEIVASNVTWTANGDGNPGELIYGYFVYETGASKVVYAERDPGAPFSFDTLGDTYAIVPTFVLRSRD